MHRCLVHGGAVYQVMQCIEHHRICDICKLQPRSTTTHYHSARSFSKVMSHDRAPCEVMELLQSVLNYTLVPGQNPNSLAQAVHSQLLPSSHHHVDPNTWTLITPKDYIHQTRLVRSGHVLSSCLAGTRIFYHSTAKQDLTIS